MAAFAKNEREIADRARAFLKAELKRRSLTYDDLAERLAKHGMKGETRDSITSKLARGMFAATFFLACLAAMELQMINLEDI
jgi:hypothetical protein